MGEVNEYFKEKYEDNQEEFKRKLKKHKLAILYRVLLITAILVVVVIAVYYNYQRMVYTSYDVFRKLDYTQSANAHFLNLNGNVLRYSQDGASLYSMDNEMIWNETFEMQNPLVDVCKDYIAIGDYKDAVIYVFNSSGLQGKIDTTIPVRSFCVSGTGIVAAVLEDDDVTWVKLYDAAGTNIASDRTTMAKSGYPVDVDISDNGIMLAVSYLYIDSGIISTSVAYYNFGAVGQNEIDNLVSGYNYSNTVVSYLEFMNEKTSFIVGDNIFAVFEGDQKPEKKFEVSIDKQILSVFNNEEYIGLVYEGEEGQLPYCMEVYDTAGNLVMSQQFELEYTDILFHKDLAIIYNANECVIYNMQGLKKFEGSFKESAITLIPTANKTRFLLVSGDGMEEIQLK